MMRYFIGFLVTIGLIVLIIVLLLSGRGTKAPTVKALNLSDYSNGSSAVQMLIDGPVVADQNHREIKVEISQSDVTLTVYSGYQDNIVRSQSYANNSAAYAVFLRSLQHSGFTLYTPGVTSDERGYCPAGDRYILSLTNNGSDVRRTWTTSCGTNIKGSFAGPIDPVRQLFQLQVPDYANLTQDISL